MKTELRSKSAPTPVGPYSQGIDSGVVYCAGQVGADPYTGVLDQGVVAQTSRALTNLESVLKATGLGLNNIAKTTVYMVDLSEFGTMNDEYAKHFSPPYPARTTVQVAALPKGALVEIEAVATR
jgi:2-iminobutanoate/2-iminopropanoate deaminase